MGSAATHLKKCCITNALNGTEDDIVENAINDSEISDSEESETEFDVSDSHDHSA